MEPNVIDLLINRFGQNPKDWSYTHLSERYLISNFGEVISLIGKARILKKPKNQYGYFFVSIMDNRQKRVNAAVHRLVAEAFVKKASTGFNKRNHVNHINGIKTDNSASNLEWVSQAENNSHAIETGLNKLRGEDNPRSKLTKNQVSEIKLNIHRLSRKEIAGKYCVSVSAINRILSGKGWLSHEA